MARHEDTEDTEDRARHAAWLTPREREVLRALCAGKRPREIAGEMTVELDTVWKHIKAVYRKLEVHGMLELALTAPKLGLLDDEGGGMHAGGE